MLLVDDSPPSESAACWPPYIYRVDKCDDKVFIIMIHLNKIEMLNFCTLNPDADLLFTHSQAAKSWPPADTFCCALPSQIRTAHKNLQHRLWDLQR